MKLKPYVRMARGPEDTRRVLRELIQTLTDDLTGQPLGDVKRRLVHRYIESRSRFAGEQEQVTY